MGWRYRKRVTLFPGVTLNFSKSGVSTTFGIPGSSVNLNKDGVYLNSGIPGVGIYDRTKLTGFDKDIPNEDNVPSKEEVIYYQPYKELKSAAIDTLTSSGLVELKETLLAAYNEEKEILYELKKCNEELDLSKRRFARFKFIPFAKSLFPKAYLKRLDNININEEKLAELKEQKELCNVNINIELNSDCLELFSKITSSFEFLMKSELIWDITTQRDTDKYRERTTAEQTIERKKVNFNYDRLSFIECKFAAFHLENRNGADIYIYPGFLIFFKNDREFALIDFNDLKIEYINQSFIESEKVPSDSVVVGQTWAKANKDGSRDKRFSDNYQIPIVKYGKLVFTSSQGMNEHFMISNPIISQQFFDLFIEYKKRIQKE